MSFFESIINSFKFIKNIEKIKFRFDDSFFTLSQYLTKKINYFYNIEIIDKNMIIKYF